MPENHFRGDEFRVQVSQVCVVGSRYCRAGGPGIRCDRRESQRRSRGGHRPGSRPRRLPRVGRRRRGAGLVILGAGLGIGKLAASAVESMARQPEVAGNIQTAMIIAAALIEGVTFFALIVCLLSKI